MHLHLNSKYSTMIKPVVFYSVFQKFGVVKECTDKLQLIKKQMLSMHQEVKQLKVNIIEFVRERSSMALENFHIECRIVFFSIQKRSDNLLKFRDKELSILRQKQLQEEDLIAKSSPSNKESN